MMMNASVDYSKQSDKSLITLYHLGDHKACTVLLARYANLINYRISHIGIIGVDADDLRQEAYMGLYNAIRTYDPVKNPNFSGYAVFCIKNSIKNLYAANLTQKAKMYQKTVLVNNIEEISTQLKNDINPENIYLNKEACNHIKEIIDKLLSDFEKEVLFSYLSGFEYKNIAAKLRSSQKSVDNALQRARRKLKAVLNNL